MDSRERLQLPMTSDQWVHTEVATCPFCRHEGLTLQDPVKKTNHVEYLAYCNKCPRTFRAIYANPSTRFCDGCGASHGRSIGTKYKLVSAREWQTCIAKVPCTGVKNFCDTYTEVQYTLQGYTQRLQ